MLTAQLLKPLLLISQSADLVRISLQLDIMFTLFTGFKLMVNWYNLFRLTLKEKVGNMTTLSLCVISSLYHSFIRFLFFFS